MPAWAKRITASTSLSSSAALGGAGSAWASSLSYSESGRALRDETADREAEEIDVLERLEIECLDKVDRASRLALRVYLRSLGCRRNALRFLRAGPLATTGRALSTTTARLPKRTRQSTMSA